MPSSTFSPGSGLSCNPEQPFLSRSAVLQRNNVRVIGTNKPVMLFSHGFGCDQSIWRFLTPTLAIDYQLVLLDHVGAGQSDQAAYDSQKYGNLDGYARDIVEICQALDLRDVVLVGHSVGAMIAMLAAIRAPEHFSRLVLLAPSPCYLNEPSYVGGFDRADIDQLLAFMDSDYGSWATMFAALLAGDSNDPTLGMELTNRFCSTDSVLAKQFARVAFLSDNRADVTRLQLPTLLLQCAQDAVAPAEVGEYLAQHMPHATLVQLQTTGHCPHLSAPLETLAAMRTYLN